jgi:hypothetical protein
MQVQQIEAASFTRPQLTVLAGGAASPVWRELPMPDHVDSDDCPACSAILGVVRISDGAALDAMAEEHDLAVL